VSFGVVDVLDDGVAGTRDHRLAQGAVKVNAPPFSLTMTKRMSAPRGR